MNVKGMREPVVLSLGTGRVRVLYDAFMIAMALLVVSLLFTEDSGWSLVANRTVYGIFVADYLLRLSLSTDRKAFVRANLVDLLAILPADQFRALRFLRLLRVVRAVSIFARASRDMRGILGTNGLSWMLLMTITVVSIGATIVHELEDSIETWGDAFWWATVTATTVGYGDISPETSAARVVAVVLMFVGIGTIGMLTGSIATYFLGGRQTSSSPHMTHIQALLTKWDSLSLSDRHSAVALLASMVEQPPDLRLNPDDTPASDTIHERRS